MNNPNLNKGPSKTAHTAFPTPIIIPPNTLNGHKIISRVCLAIIPNIDHKSICSFILMANITNAAIKSITPKTISPTGLAYKAIFHAHVATVTIAVHAA